MEKDIKKLISEFEEACIERKRSSNLLPAGGVTEQKMYESAGKPDFKENLEAFIDARKTYPVQCKGLNGRYYELRAQILEKAEAVRRCVHRQILDDYVV